MKVQQKLNISELRGHLLTTGHGATTPTGDGANFTHMCLLYNFGQIIITHKLNAICESAERVCIRVAYLVRRV